MLWPTSTSPTLSADSATPRAGENTVWGSWDSDNHHYNKDSEDVMPMSTSI